MICQLGGQWNLLSPLFFVDQVEAGGTDAKRIETREQFWLDLDVQDRGRAVS